MRILGIDPGLAIVGYSVVDFENDEFTLITSGSVQTDKTKSDAQRLLEIEEDLQQIVEKYSPDVASIEKLFFFKNAKTIIPVAEARGVILSVLEKNKIKIEEYTPLVVKQTLTGYGRATKDEVAKMVMVSLNTNSLPKLDDTVDSIAMAVCHARNLVYN